MEEDPIPTAKDTSLSHITVDLGQKRVEAALSILRQRKRRKKVASALIHTKSSRYGRIAYNGKVSNQELFVRVFEALTDFPKLKQLSVVFDELETFIKLPIACLLLVLTQPQSRIRVLAFSNVRFSGDDSDMEAMAEAVRCHSSLSKVTFQKCSGETASLDPVLHSLASVPTMREVILDNTRIRSHDPYAQDSLTWDGSSLVQLCRTPSQVRKLVLKDVPDIRNELVVNIAKALSSNKSKLRDLTLSSIRLGDTAAVSLMSMLEANRHLTALALDFEVNLLSCGQAIADALATNTRLERISLTLSSQQQSSASEGNYHHSSVLSLSSASSSGEDDDYDDDDNDSDSSEQRRQKEIDAIDANIALLATSLRCNTSLRHFLLCLDLDDYVLIDDADVDEDDNEYMVEEPAALIPVRRSSMADDSSTHNYVMPNGIDHDPVVNATRRPLLEPEDLDLSNRGEEAYHKITQAFEDLLHYNFTLCSLQVTDGIHEWKTFQDSIAFNLKLNRAGIRRLLQQENATKEQWVHAMLEQKDDINVLYYLLSRNPSLCCDIFGHVRDNAFREHSVAASLGKGEGEHITKEDKKDAKKLSWWKRGTKKRSKMIKRVERVFSLKATA